MVDAGFADGLAQVADIGNTFFFMVGTRYLAPLLLLGRVLCVDPPSGFNLKKLPCRRPSPHPTATLFMTPGDHVVGSFSRIAGVVRAVDSDSDLELALARAGLAWLDSVRFGLGLG